MKVLVTGVAGFIGMHCARRLLSRGHVVTGIDNLGASHDVQLKRDRLALLEPQAGFSFERLDLVDRAGMAILFREQAFDAVIHLGAEPAARYSFENPLAYVDSNVGGMVSVLEGCRRHGVGHLIYASSYCVHGADASGGMPSFHAAAKRADETMAATYARLYGLPATGLRLFSVYGSWGRPDAAYYRFADAIRAGQPIELHNEGRMSRDFVHIDDVVELVERMLVQPPEVDAAGTPHRLYDLGRGRLERIADLVSHLERLTGRRASKLPLPMQPGEMEGVPAKLGDMARDFGFAPAIGLADGMEEFVAWHREYNVFQRTRRQ